MDGSAQKKPFSTTYERTPKTRPGGRGSKLTQRFVNEIRAPVEGKLRIPDGEIHGLFLRVTANGSKAYILRYSLNGHRGEYTVGDASAITLVAARAKAVQLHTDIVIHGIDPVTAKQEAIRKARMKREETFAALVERYMVDAQRRKRPSSIVYETWSLNRHILPKIGERAYGELKRADIISMIEQIGENGGYTTANRAHGIVRHILNYALKRDLIDANPALSIERIFPEQSRDRILNESEIQIFWKFLDAAMRNEGAGLKPGQMRGERNINGVSPSVAIALKVSLLTLQRAGEVSGMHRSEASWIDRLSIIPASRMKSRRAHAVPLSPLTLDLVNEAFDRSGGSFAFPNKSGQAALVPERLTRAMRRCCEITGMAHAGPHDLRRTGRTFMTSERVGVSYDVAERVIAHLVGSAVSRVYDRNEYVREKRAALNAWADELVRIVEG